MLNISVCRKGEPCERLLGVNVGLIELLVRSEALRESGYSYKRLVVLRGIPLGVIFWYFSRER